MRPGAVVHGLIHSFGHGLWGKLNYARFASRKNACDLDAKTEHIPIFFGVRRQKVFKPITINIYKHTQAARMSEVFLEKPISTRAMTNQVSIGLWMKRSNPLASQRG
jgi:hypothetical protein